MKRILGLAALLLSVSTGCANLGDQGGPQGGANANDRSTDASAGEQLESGAMTVSPTGNFIVARRNQSTLIVDVKAQKYTELQIASDRFAFAKSKDVVYVLEGTDVVAIDLATAADLWRVQPIFSGGSTIFMRVSDDDRSLFLVDEQKLWLLDTADGNIRGATKSGAGVTDFALMPDRAHALVVGRTTWADGGPHTPVSLLPLDGQDGTTIDVPNCSAPIAVLADSSRALLSPTFCTPDQASTGGQPWSNPDPVSVIDIDAAHNQLSFLKNLPGFGPVALLDGKAIAYLDTKRMDPAMFTNQAQVPAANAPEYQLMTIDPKSLSFDLTPIGATLPRFAPSKDGKSLLVDASVEVKRVFATPSASASISIGPSGIKAQAEVKLGSFGDDSGSLFGVFSVESRTYLPFAGSAATLDRFVQVADGSKVFTLKNNGSGGDLYAVDVAGRSATALNLDLRDIAILPDGRTLVLRIRDKPTDDGYLREHFSFTTDGVTITSTIRYQGTTVQVDEPGTSW